MCVNGVGSTSSATFIGGVALRFGVVFLLESYTACTTHDKIHKDAALAKKKRGRKSGMRR